MIFKNIEAADVRKRMTEIPEKWLAICPSISLEHLKDGKEIGWCHVDVRNGHNCLRLFNV